MQLRTITRLSAAGFAVCLIAGAAAAMFAPGASATARDRITINQDEAKEIVYPAMVGNHVIAQADASTAYNKDICDVDTSCDAIPLTIGKAAGLSDIDEYYVTVKLIWDTQEVQNVPEFGEYTVNDLDMYITNDPVVDGAGPDEDGFVYHSAGTAQPEIIQMFRPEGDFLILVGNATGANLGYTLQITWSTDVLPNPFESLPPTFSQTGVATPKSTSSGTPTPVQLPSIGDGSVDVGGAPDLAVPGIAAPDTSFDSGFTDAASLSDVIVGPKVEISRASAVKAAPPSNLALLLWLIAFPLGLMALGGTFLLRRSASLMRF